MSPLYGDMSLKGLKSVEKAKRFFTKQSPNKTGKYSSEIIEKATQDRKFKELQQIK
jgi:hypothetical protein